MFLSELELVGFKSFADKTVIKFSEGLTAIVGPNGCGKSNIVDAIRWVLGEQRTSVLRANTMQNVIFNGSRLRKPLGMAEVSITFENTRQVLPTEYTAVRVTRRLFRDGESQYLLNRSRCRYRDIQDLFMDTGIGANAYSVIELSMIDSILSERQEERRRIFDEAAGITRYKVRRKEAQRRLETLQADIARIQDLVAEVERSVRSLSRQAKKAERYAKLKQTVATLRQILLVRQYRDLREQEEQLRQQLEDIVSEKSEREERFVHAELEIATIEEQLNQLEKQAATVQQQLAEVRQRQQNLEKQIIARRERQRALNEALAAANRRKVEIEERLQALEKDIQSTADRLRGLEAEQQRRLEQVQNYESTVNELRQQLKVQQQQVEQWRKQEVEILEQLRSVEAEQERERAQLEAIRRQIATLVERQQRDQQRVAALETEIAELEQQRSTVQQAIQAIEQQIRTARRQKQEWEQQLRRWREQVSDLRSEIRHLETTLEFLEGLVVSAESSRFLLEHSQWAAQYRPAPLAEWITVPAEYAEAFSSVLAPYLQIVVVDQVAAVDEALRLLRQYNKGRVSLLVLEQIQSISAPPSLPQYEGVIGYASEIAEVAKPQLRFLLRMVLDRTVVVESVEIAHSVVQQHLVPAAVALDGTLVTHYGLYRGGSSVPTEAALLGRQQRIAQLRADRDQRSQQERQLRERIQQLEQQLRVLPLESLQQQLREKERELHQIEQQIVQLRSQKAGLQENLDHMREALQQLEVQQQHLVSQSSSKETALAPLQEQKRKIEQQRKEAQHTLQQIQQHYDFAVQQLQQEQEALTAIRLQIAEEQARRQHGLVEIQTMTRQLEDLQQRIHALEAERKTEEQQLTVLVEQFRQQQVAVEQQQHRAEDYEQQIQQLRQILQQKVRALQQQQQRIQEMQQEIYEFQLQLQTLQSRIDRLDEQSHEHFSCAITALSLPDSPMAERSTEELQQEYEEYRMRLESFGAVNLLAFEEYQREAERLKFLQEQLTDLLEAEKTLKATIREINKTAVQQFRTVFEQIRKRFQELFQTLFESGDQADLTLEGEDLLEARIEIIAKPRGKRPHSIEMLSAGEKTLTAIALLFAIYYVKPSPFCILDEVDAPLDDANIERFLRLLRDLSQSTQFILITHNKKTMEAADVLYGVTMGNDGVSTIVSVRLAVTEAT